MHEQKGEARQTPQPTKRAALAVRAASMPAQGHAGKRPCASTDKPLAHAPSIRQPCAPSPHIGCASPEAFSRAGYFTLEAEAPNPRLYSFEGAICCWDMPPTSLGALGRGAFATRGSLTAGGTGGPPAPPGPAAPRRAGSPLRRPGGAGAAGGGGGGEGGRAEPLGGGAWGHQVGLSRGAHTHARAEGSKGSLFNLCSAGNGAAVHPAAPAAAPGFQHILWHHSIAPLPCRMQTSGSF
jgi:hypothetical protein